MLHRGRVHPTKAPTAARYHLDRCGERAGSTPAVPWFEAAREEIAASTAGFGRLTIDASVANVRLRLAGVARFEIDAPAVLWVEPGADKVIGTAPDLGERSLMIMVAKGDRASVTLEFEANAPMEPLNEIDKPESPVSLIPGIATIAGGLVVAALGASTFIRRPMMSGERPSHLSRWPTTKATSVRWSATKPSRTASTLPPRLPSVSVATCSRARSSPRSHRPLRRACRPTAKVSR